MGKFGSWALYYHSLCLAAKVANWGQRVSLPICLRQPRSNKRYCKLLLELNSEEDDDRKGYGGLLSSNTFKVKLFCSVMERLHRYSTFVHLWWWKKSCVASLPVAALLFHWLSFLLKTKLEPSSWHRLHFEGKFGLNAKSFITVCLHIWRGF